MWGGGGQTRVTSTRCPSSSRKWRSGQSLTAPQVSHPRVSVGCVCVWGGSDKGDLYSMSIIFQEVALRTEPYSTTGLTPEGDVEVALRTEGGGGRSGSDKGDLYSMSIIFQEVALRTEPYSTTGLTPEGEWGVCVCGGGQTRVTSTRCASSSRKWRSGQSLTAPQVSHPRVSVGCVCVGGGSDKGDLYSMCIIFQEVALRTEPYSTTGLTPEGEWGVCGGVRQETYRNCR